MYLENGVDVELHRGGQAVLGVALHSVHQVLSCVYTLVRRRAPRPQNGGSMEKRPGDVEWPHGEAHNADVHQRHKESSADNEEGTK